MLAIKANADVIRNIVKGHLVSHHGETLTAELTDSVSKLILESINNFFVNINSDVEKIDRLINKEDGA